MHTGAFELRQVGDVQPPVARPAGNDDAAAAGARWVVLCDTNGGTFTLTNVGTFGSIMGTPIINQPEVAIIGPNAILERPVVREGRIVVRNAEYKNGDRSGTLTATITRAENNVMMMPHLRISYPFRGWF